MSNDAKQPPMSQRGLGGDQAQGAFPSPSLSLPKGGGAIRGMGEKFAANPVTGTGAMTVPIATSSGRSGFGPQLSLSYDSGSGNGVFGFGWSLSIPSVTRKTSRGLPQYRDAEESDVFVLASAEDLVPVYRQDLDGSWIAAHPGHTRETEGSWVRDAAGRRVLHEDEIEGYRVRRYRPRIEGLFSIIERWSSVGDESDVHWRTLSRDNVLTVYGLEASARIADPSEPSHIFSWLICETRDDKGNAVLYRYKAEDGIGTDLGHAHERNRGPRGDVRRTAQRYLKRIHYGNRVPLLGPASRPRFLDEREINAQVAAGRWMFEVVFDYGDHTAEAPKPNDDGEADASGAPRHPWTFRSDPFSTYRAGFEVRTTRLCKRVLMFHHFPEQSQVGRDCLVRSTDFTYSAQLDPRNVQSAAYSFLRQVSQTGYRRAAAGYTQRSLPPLSFEYTEPTVQDVLELVDAESVENLPIGMDGDAYRWMDLHGEGLTGILTEQAGAWFYKRNLSPLTRTFHDGQERVTARFAPTETVAFKPNMALGAGAQLLDLAGDGLPDVVTFDGPVAGLYEHDEAENWQPFRSFTSRLNRDLRDPNLKLIDLDGDGHLDVLITENGAFVLHMARGEAGFGPARRLQQALDEEKGPRIVFADLTQTIFLADLSGDGLTDLVRIRNGEVCYWPNLGYGKFGAKVTMDQAPLFDHPEHFDPRRIRLADIDGSGTTDIIYLHAEGVRLYFNQSGNGWSKPHVLKLFPRVDDLVTIAAVDLLGNGTACLVWSSALSGDATRPMRYVNLMKEGKPHLLARTVNNLGAETRVRYAPSTQYYLEDKRAGKPWLTRLPFPVHVVERVETYDHISRHRFVARYAYHHGYYDGDEREFRGFGMVEQWDTEAFEDYVVGVERADGTQETAPELLQPPVTTRTWFHTGAFLRDRSVLHPFRHEYYAQGQHVEEPALPSAWSTQELREHVRALKGLLLRQETYSFDGSPEQDHPYAVTENGFEVRKIQPQGDQQHGVFLPLGRESLSLGYERNPADPRASQSFVLETDELGNPLKSCSIAYGRRLADASLPAEVTRDQQRTYVTYAETDHTEDIEQGLPPTNYRQRVPFESRSYEITGIAPQTRFFTLDEIKAKIAASAPIDYEVVADGVAPQKRLLSQSRALFLDDALSPLPLGQWDSLGLVHQTFGLALTKGVADAHYAGQVRDAELAAAGYVHFDGDDSWWIPSGTAIYPLDPRSRFYQPIGSKDPLGLETVATRDIYDLLTERVEIRQAAWSVSTAVNDYRLLVPVSMTDPNKNRSVVEHDELGMVVKTAIMGKAGSADGDTLADPTTRMEYELFNWSNHRKPNFVHTFSREQHGAANPRWQETYAYTNGIGGVAMVKTQTHPGKAISVQPDGRTTEVDADPRWVGNGRTVLNNKGRPVKQYEPYFSTTHEYEDEAQLREIGVTPVHYYDAIGRSVRTSFPNGTFARVELGPWARKVFDANDTVRESQWYRERGSPDPATEPEPTADPERRAAWLAAKHADTPGTMHFDSLGRPIHAVSDYGGGKTAAVRSEVDLTGRYTRMFDQERREVASGFVGMAGMPIVGESAEKGRRWTFSNVLGSLVKTWDEHGRQFRAELDDLHRPVSMFVKEAGSGEILFNYVVYGDRLANGEQLNLLGAAHQVFDQAGMVRVPALDFKGNPAGVERTLAKDYQNGLDWSALSTATDYAGIQAAAEPMLEVAEVFTASSQYDAINRPTRVVMPDGTVVVPSYNEANYLSSLSAQLRGRGAFVEFLRAQEYDAKGQRRFAQHGNDVLMRYFYDAKTFRLTNLLTHKVNATPQTEALQNLHYTYDPTGNITQTADRAQQTQYFGNAVVAPESLYEYDAVYQLVRATGRELAALVTDTVRTHSDIEPVQLPHINDTQAVRTYREEYEYDLLGNIRVLKHRFQARPGAGSGWTRVYRYAFEDAPGDRTNRLTATSQPDDPEGGPLSGAYAYDAFGNMTRMPHLASLSWNFMDQLRRVDLGGGGTAHYVYGVGGQRVRKVIERNADLMLEWIFVGSVMLFRRRRRSDRQLQFERWTVHISDNTGRIAQVDVKTRDDDDSDPDNALNAPVVRYQYTNHMGSATLETDEAGNPISYEEYHPYGTTAYRSAKTSFAVSMKRYRFSGKERDDETGLYYFGARYYAPWLGRWTSSDPLGFVSGFNLFRYCGNSPVMYSDPTGTEEVRYRLEDVNLSGVTDPAEASRRLRAQGLDFTGFDASGQEVLPDASGRGVGLARLVGGNWEVGHWLTPPGEGDGAAAGAGSGDDSGQAPGTNGSAGITEPAPEAIRKNPTGPTVEVPNQFSDAKVDAMRERIQTDRGVGLRGEPPGGGERTADIRARSQGMRNQYNNSLPPNQRASRANGIDIDHVVELQYIIRGNAAAGADTVRPQDHAPQASGPNRSDGRTARTISDRQIAAGIPEDVPAGGVARSSDIGAIRNSPHFRTGMRWGGYGLMAAGPALTAYGALNANNPYVKAGGLGAAGVEAAGAGYYFYGRFALGGANGFAAGRSAMLLGGRVAMGAGGVGQALLSGYMAYEDYQRGDWTAFGFDTAAALGGVALVAAAVVSAPAVAAGLAIVGIATGIAAGIFHAGRYFGWWD